MSKEAMTLALELFEQFGRDSRLKYEHQAIYKTIVALKEALANHIPDDTKMVSGVKDSLTTQQEQGELDLIECGNCHEGLSDMEHVCKKCLGAGWVNNPKQEQGEPLEYWNAVEGWVKLDEVREHFDSVNCATIYKNGGEGRVPLYTTPQQRTWVGLTDEERNHARQTITYSQLAMTAGEWTEAVQIETERRLKEKNK